MNDSDDTEYEYVDIDELGAVETDTEAEDIEREAIEAESAELDIDVDYLDYDIPDWDDEFFDDWGDEIDYEIFTVLS